MTDRFVRNTAVIAIGQASVKLAQLVIAVALVRLLSLDDWTTVALALSIHLVLSTVGALNVHQSLAYFLPRTPEAERRSLVLRCYTSVLGLGTAIAVATGAAAFAGVVAPDRAVIVVLSVIAAAFEMPTPCVGTTLITLERFSAAAWWDIAGTALLVGAAIGPAVAGWGALGVVGGLVAAGATECLLGYLVLRAVLPGERRVARGTTARLVRHGLPLGITVAVAMVNRAVDKWLIAGFAPADFGVYVIAAQEVPLLAVLPYAGGAALLTAFVDAFRRGDVALARTHWLHLTARMSRVVVPLGVALVLVAPEVLGMMFTGDFSAAVPSFRVFTLVTIHRVAEYGLLLRAAGHTRAVLAIAAITLLANAAFAGVGAAAWGMLGASIGTALATGVGWWCALRAIGRTLGVPIRHAFAWSAWLASVAIAGVAAIAAGLIAEVAARPLWPGAGAMLAVKLGAFVAFLALGLRCWRHSPRSAGPAARYVPQSTITRPFDEEMPMPATPHLALEGGAP